MKKIIIVLLTFCFFGVVKINAEIEMNQFLGEKTVNGYNIVRQLDFIVIYNQSFERNNSGFEVLVDENNYIVEKDVLVDLKPKTYIISSHGIHINFFINTLNIGDKVVKEGETLKFYRHLKDSNLKRIDLVEKEVDAVVKTRVEQFYDIDLTRIEALNQEIEGLKINLNTYLSNGNLNSYDLNKKVNEILYLVDMKYYFTFEQYNVEGRAIWHRPNASGIKETNLSGLKKFVNEIYELGFNTLFVETFWDGMTTYYSDEFNYQHPTMANYEYGEYGKDYTKALISECHKRGIEVHAWTEVLCGGRENFIPPYIKAEWLTTDLEGNQTEIFLDPSNDEVQDFLKRLHTEMLEKYDFDGISYDYIRYAETTTYLKYRDNGFSDNSIKKFKAEYNYSGNSLQQDLTTNLDLRKQWHSFKTKYITKTVKNLSNLIHSKNPEIIVSASPYGFVDGAKEAYMQDIDTWLKKGYLDLILPMCYSESVNIVQIAARKIDEYNLYTLQYTGISPMYNRSTMKINQKLVQGLRDLNISGNAFFATQNYIVNNNLKLSAEIKDILTTSSHKNQAVTPTSNVNEVYYRWKELLIKRMNTIYANSLSKSEFSLLENTLSKTDFSIKNPNDIHKILKSLEVLSLYTQRFENKDVSNRIIEQIDYISKILNYSISRHLIKYGYWDIENNQVRPDVATIDFKEQIPDRENNTTTTTQPPENSTTSTTTQKPNNNNCSVNKKSEDGYFQIAAFVTLLCAGIYLIKRKS